MGSGAERTGGRTRGRRRSDWDRGGEVRGGKWNIMGQGAAGSPNVRRARSTVG